jgi:hypothetical protein
MSYNLCKPCLQAYAEQLKALLPDALHGIYLYGSLVLDAALPEIEYNVSDGVLTLCRILYTLEEQGLESKVRAGHYTQKKCPPCGTASSVKPYAFAREERSRACTRTRRNLHERPAPFCNI